MNLSPVALVVRYSVFAAIATALNVTAQAASLELYRGAEALALSILAGTAAGFLAKYTLDKRFIFFDRRASMGREFAKLFLYGSTAILTTLIFWGLELSLLHVYGTALAKYTGAVIGLAIGYVLKYNLDKRFVFASGA